MKQWWLVCTVLIIGLTLQGCQTQPVISSEVKALQVKAEAGDADSQFMLANLFDSGRNGSKAVAWYKEAAQQGHAEAQNSLGSIYQAEKRYSEALSWYKKAAKQGHALAINNLAYLYDLGLGVSQNRQKGHDLYMKSANLGWAEAMLNLANMYGAGQLGEIDNYKAYIWCSRSGKYAESGWRDLDRRSSQCLEYLKRKLPLEEITKARQEAANWAPNEIIKPIDGGRLD